MNQIRKRGWWALLAATVIGVVPLWSTTAGALAGPAPRPSPLAGTSWVLDPSSLGVPVPNPITAEFGPDRVGGSAGCNLYNGPYTTRGRSIDIGAIITTKRACTPGPAAAEGAYLKRLDAVSSFLVLGNRLILRGSAGTLAYRKATTAAPTFVGTWRVTGYLGGTPGAIVPVIDGTVITLTFGADGTVSGQACNTYNAHWTSSGGASLAIGAIASTRMFCTGPGVMTQEGQYFAALQSTASFTVDAGQLVLSDAGGRKVVTAVAAVR